MKNQNFNKFIAGLCALCLSIPAGVAITAQAKETIIPGAVSVQDAGDLQAFAQQVVNLVNQERAKAGLSALQSVAVLDACAQKRSEELVSTFSHTRPDGTNCATILDEYGVKWRTTGENIAYGYATPESVMKGWMDSAGHRANILNANFDSIGVGVVSRNGVLYWTQVFAGGITGTVTAPEQKPDQNQKPVQDQTPDAPEQKPDQSQNQEQVPDFSHLQKILENLLHHQSENVSTDQPCIGEACPVTENPSFRDFLSGLQSQCKDGNCQIQIFTSNSCKS